MAGTRPPLPIYRRSRKKVMTVGLAGTQTGTIRVIPTGSCYLWWCKYSQEISPQCDSMRSRLRCRIPRGVSQFESRRVRTLSTRSRSLLPGPPGLATWGDPRSTKPPVPAAAAWAARRAGPRYQPVPACALPLLAAAGPAPRRNTSHNPKAVKNTIKI